MDTIQTCFCLLMGGMVTLVLVEFFRSIFGAKNGERISGALILVVSTVLTVFSSQLQLPPMLFPFVGILSLGLLVFYAIRARDSLMESVYDSKELAEYSLANFDLLDADKDGIVSDDDLLLMSVLNKAIPVLRPGMIASLRRDLRHIGHVVREETIVMPSSMGPGIVSVNVYGISREDLQSYPQRIRDIYEANYDEYINA